MMRMLITGLLIASLITTAAVAPMAMAQEARDAYSAGFQDGKEDGQADASLMKVVWGAVFGPLAVGYNLFVTPRLPDDRVVRIADQGEDYTEGYLRGYRAGFKQQAVIYNFIGWASWLLLAVIGGELGEFDMRQDSEYLTEYNF